MRWINFEHNQRPGWGLIENDQVRPISNLASAPDSLKALIELGEEGVDWARSAAPLIESIPIADVRYAPVIRRPGKVIALGRNYAAHAKEGGAKVPSFPMLFHKTHTSLNHHLGQVIIEDGIENVDYEGELAVVIGHTCKSVSEDEAMAVVFGYTVANDITSRELQRRTSQFTSGKMIDGFGPLGPILVTADEIGDVSNLVIQTRLNGELMQNGNTKDMIFSVPFTISYISKITTLEPGDIILTGTPEGVGMARTPPVYLRPGDEISVEISQLGRLTNTIVAPGGSHESIGA